MAACALTGMGVLRSFADQLAVAAALAQAAGYLLYIRHILRGETRPNAASFFMFAYGTGLLVVLEYEAGATWRVLLLPTTCALLGIVVAGLCLRTAWREPIDPAERVAFALDLALTAAYLSLFTLHQGSAFAPPERAAFALAFLLASNATTVTAFVPILRSTYQEPTRERPLPWLVWSLAYGLLLATVALTDPVPILLLYPALNLVLHAGIAALSLARRA